MFEKSKDVGHRCVIDNLFMYVRFAHESFNLLKKVLVHGVIRKLGRDVPACIIQEEFLGEKADQVQGTVKSAILKGNSKYSNLFFSCCYDQKPF